MIDESDIDNIKTATWWQTLMAKIFGQTYVMEDDDGIFIKVSIYKGNLYLTNAWKEEK